jgi:hypothetical protein
MQKASILVWLALDMQWEQIGLDKRGERLRDGGSRKMRTCKLVIPSNCDMLLQNPSLDYT